MATTNSGISYHGRILKADGTPLQGSSVQFQLTIRSPGNENCLLYQELQTLDMANSNGVFSITINDGSGTRTDTTGISFNNVFSNRSTFTLASGACASGLSYTPNNADGRSFVVAFRDESMSTFETLPTQMIAFAPSAIQALNLAGYAPGNLLKFDDSVLAANASPLNNTQYANLIALINGTSTQYLKTGSNGTGVLPITSTAPTSPTAGEIWFDSSSNTIKYFNGTSTQALGSGSGAGTVTSVTAGTGLTGGTITSSGTIALGTVGTAGAYYKVNTDAYGRVTSGVAALVEGDIPTLTTTGHVAGSAISGTIGGSTIVSTTGAITTTGVVTAGTVTTNSLGAHSVVLSNTANTHTTTLSAPTLTSDYNLIFPDSAGLTGNMLITDGAGHLSWASAGGAPSGAAGGDLAGTYPNPTVAGLRGKAISATLPTAAGQVLKYDGTSTYAPGFINGADIRSSVSGSAAFFPTLACTASQTLAYSSVTDTLTCATISVTAATGILPVANGGTGTATGSISGTGALAFAAGGTNQNVTLTPSGTGFTLLNGNVGIGFATPQKALDVAGGAALRATSKQLFIQDSDGGVTDQNVVVMNQDSSTFTMETASDSFGSGQPFLSVSRTALAPTSVNFPNGSVGIGTTSPTSPLTVAGIIQSTTGGIKFPDGTTQTTAASAPGSASISGLTAATATNSPDSLNFAQTWNWSTATTQNPMTMTANGLTTGSLLSLTSSNASLNSTSGLLNVANTGSSTTGTVARIQSNSAAGSGLYVLANGLVGIGTTSPSAYLEVSNGDTWANEIRITDTSTGGRKWGLQSVGSAQANPGNFQIYDQSGGGVRLAINYGGSVGIGTAAPTVSLDVGARTDAIRVPNGTAAQQPVGATGMIRYNTDTSQLQSYIGSAWVNLATSASGGGATQWTTTASNIYYSTGNVGIGTTSPASALDVTGAIDIAGLNAISVPNSSSLAIGASGLAGGGAGTNNVAAGVQTLATNTGQKNSAFGSYALSGGSYNAAFGYRALGQNTGNNNTAVGSAAISNGVGTGGANTGVGFEALYALTSGSNNVAVGTTAGGWPTGVTTGSNNVIIGSGVGSSTLTTGSSNILIGTSNSVDTPLAATNNFIDIGNAIFVTGATGTLAAPAGNIGIGTSSPTSPLTVAGVIQSTTGGIKFPDGTTQSTAASAPGSASISGLTAATATNSPDSLNFAQTWNWSTATTQNPMTMNANALTTGSLLSLTSSNTSLNSTSGLLNVANTGTSTTGVVARIQANSTAGSGLNVLANGNVGVGTTSPQTALQVNLGGSVPASFSAGSGDALIVNKSSGPGDWARMYLLGGSGASGTSTLFFGNVSSLQNGSISSYYGNNMMFSTNGSERFRVDGSGNFGIGNQSPTSLLHTTDTAAKTATYTGILHAVTNTSSTASINKFGMDIESTGAWTGSSAVNTGLVVNATGGTTNYAATFNGGNVGIGTTSPAYSLQVTDVSANPTLEVGPSTSASSSNAAIYLSGKSSGVQSQAKIYADYTSNLNYQPASGQGHYFNSGSGSNVMTLLSSGNVGIGTTSPQAGLDIATTGTAASALIVPRDSTANRPTTAVNGMIRYNTTNSQLESYVGSAWVNLATSASGGGASQWTTAGSNIYYSGGNVGVGTTSPAGILDVEGGTATSGNGSNIQISAQNGFGTGNTNGGNILLNPGVQNGSGVSGSVKIPILTASTSATTGALVVGGGLGIGGNVYTTGTLTTTGAISTSGADITGNNIRAGFGSSVANFSTDSSKAMTFTPDGTERMRIAVGGNVGIGTTSPNASLNIITPAAHDPLKIQISGGNTLIFDQYGNLSAGGLEFANYDSNVGYAAVSTVTGNLFLTTNSGGTTTNNIILKPSGGGNVGIGTSSPTSLLTVAGVIQSTTGGIKFPDGTTQTTAASAPGSGSISGLTAATATNTPDSLNFAQTWNWSTATTQNPMTMTANALTTGSLLSLTSSNTSLNSTSGLLNVANTGASTTGTVARIQSNSTAGSGLYVLANGSVGIGTASPSSTNALSINGNETITGGLTVGPISSSNVTQMGVGANNNPSYSFLYDPGVGMFDPGGNSSNTLGFATNSLERLRITSAGNVGIGTTSAASKLNVQGAIVSNEVIVASGGTVDFSAGDSVVLQSVGGTAITLSNMVAGGVYNLVIEDTTSRTYSFTGCATAYWSPANGATTNRSVFTIYRRGSSACYITWTTGFN